MRSPALLLGAESLLTLVTYRPRKHMRQTSRTCRRAPKSSNLGTGRCGHLVSITASSWTRTGDPDWHGTYGKPVEAIWWRDAPQPAPSPDIRYLQLETKYSVLIRARSEVCPIYHFLLG